MNRLLDYFGGDPRQALLADRASLDGVNGLNTKMKGVLVDWERHFDLAKEERQADQRGVDFVSREDPDYPPLLKEISDPPIGLYRKGKYNFSKPSVAIVGTRHCTLYGQSVARSFATDLANMGFCVTSGMARGIDTFAHKGALDVADGTTVCVFGCGMDIVYPPENVDLYKDAQVNGAVISEFPFGRRADRQTFPMRNRVVSGMSHAVIVVESSAAGGSMITARFAGEQGRLVCAVPGRIDQKSSHGCHQLIRDGALLLSSVDELLEELEHLKLTPSLELPAAKSMVQPDLSESEQSLLDLLSGGVALTLEEIAGKSNTSPAQAGADLMKLEIFGVIVKRLDGKFEQAMQLR